MILGMIYVWFRCYISHSVSVLWLFSGPVGQMIKYINRSTTEWLEGLNVVPLKYYGEVYDE